MAKISRLAGSTSHVWTLFIQDSTSISGAGLTGLAYGTSGLTAYYKRNSGTGSVAVTLVAITTLGTYVSGGFKEIDSTNLPGLYEFHPPDAAEASGAKSVAFLLKGATNMVPCPLEIELTGWDNQDAIHGGMSAMPNTACTTNASLLTSGTGTDQISVSAGKTLLQATQTGVTIPTVTTVGTLTTYTGNTPQTGDSFGLIGATGSGLTSLAPASTALSTANWTNARAGYLDTLNGIVAAVWAYATRVLTAGTNIVLAKGTGLTGLNDISSSSIVTNGAIDTSSGSILSVQVTGIAVYATNVSNPVTVNAVNGLAPPADWNLLSIDGSGRVLLQPAQPGVTIPTVTAVGTAANLTNAPTAGDFTAAMKASLNASTPTGGDTSGTTTLLTRIPGTIPANGSGFTALGDARLANLDAAVSTRSTYAGGDTSGTTTLLSRVTGAVALASQVPANFTAATFASAGVFATAALANAPSGTGASASTIATAVWTDPLASSDFSTAGSAGASLKDSIKGWGSYSARQTIQAIAQFLFGVRSGVPASGSAGTVTYTGPSAYAYGTVTVDTNGDVTVSALTPPA